MRAHTISAEPVHLGFQIAPMIDVVFVIMLFFMVMAGAVKVERHITTTVPSDIPSELPADEILIGISEDGVISLNDEEIATGTDTALKLFGGRMADIQRESAARRVPAIVVVKTEGYTRYQRIVDVLNILGREGLSNVTFTVGSEE